MKRFSALISFFLSFLFVITVQAEALSPVIMRPKSSGGWTTLKWTQSESALTRQVWYHVYRNNGSGFYRMFITSQSCCFMYTTFGLTYPLGTAEFYVVVVDLFGNISVPSNIATVELKGR